MEKLASVVVLMKKGCCCRCFDGKPKAVAVVVLMENQRLVLIPCGFHN